MDSSRSDRRDFLKTSLGATALALGAPTATRAQASSAARIRFGVIGLNHGHVYSEVDVVRHGGGELVSFYAPEPDLAAVFQRRHPKARAARDRREILEDDSLQLVVSAAIPDERAPLGIEVMRHGKDFMVDKPGLVTLEQLAEVRRVQAETKRIYSIAYGRFENGAIVRAGRLVEGGAIGAVVQTIGLGPHRMHPADRPPWFFERERYGGILCDLASHQFDYFLYFTGSTTGEIVASQVGNLLHPEHPGIEDFGDALVRGDGGTGYMRVDWLTPDGLGTWGDGRLTILGTDGYIELRTTIDIAGRPGGSHLFLVDQKQTRHLDCSQEPLPYGERLVDDVLYRTETAMSQEHCFLATELSLRAEKQARRLGVGATAAGSPPAM